MPKDEQKGETISPEIQEVVRLVVSAMRAVKLYPANNPVYSQTVGKSHAALGRYLLNSTKLVIGVQKTGFFYLSVPIERDISLYKSIAADLFHKGIREITFTRGLGEKELLTFYRALAMSPDDLNRTGSISSLLWEKGGAHITVTEAALGEVVQQEKGGKAVHAGAPSTSEKPSGRLKNKEINLFGRRVVLADIAGNPAAFGSMMVAMAAESGGTLEARAARLFEYYRTAGSQIAREAEGEQDYLFNAMAESIISMDAVYREGLIATQLYTDFDRSTMQAQMKEVLEQIPHGPTEMTSARFSRVWTVPQVSALLRKAASARTLPPAPPAIRLPQDIYAISRELAEYTPEEMESLRNIGELISGETDSVSSTVRTLIHVIPLAQYSLLPQSREKAFEKFSKAVGLLEEMLPVVLDKKDYVLAASVVRVFTTPVQPDFRPRLAEAVKKAGGKKTIARIMTDIRTADRKSADYHAMYSYLSLLDREATPALLEMLAEEEDRSARKLLIQILKDLGRNQIALLGEKLSDERWYFVRNIVSILGESRREEVITYLERVAGHRNFQIRQEVVRALVAIGGKRAAGLLTKFLYDRDIDIRFMAVRGIGTLSAAGEQETKALMNFLRGGRRAAGHELKKEAIASLGRRGGPEAASFLKKYAKIRWWKPRRLQEELRATALKAIEEIERRAP